MTNQLFDLKSLSRLKSIDQETALRTGRTLWLVLYLFVIALLIISIIPRYQNVMAPYDGEQIDFFRATIPSLDLIGISQHTLALFAVSSEALYSLFLIVLGGLIYFKLPNQLFPLFCMMIVITESIGSTYLLNSLVVIHPAFGVIENFVQMISLIGISFFFSLFPNGRFVPRWTLYFSAAWGILTLLWFIFPNMPANMLNGDVAWQTPVLTMSLMSSMYTVGLGSQIYRYLTQADAKEKQQTKWIVLGILIFTISQFIRYVISLAQPDTSEIWRVGIIWISSYLPVVFPITITFALFRYRLWQVDRILSYTIVYTTLVAVLLGIYLSVILSFQYVLGSGNLMINFAATILVALLLQPIYQRLEKIITKFFFGDRDNPIEVLGMIGDRLERALSPEDVLPAIVETVHSALRVPYAAITIKQHDGYKMQSEMGVLEETTFGHLLRLPLNYQGDEVGQLWVSPRTSADPFNQQDEQLLNTIATQAGTAVHAVQLTDALQDSRQRIVTTREEERKRLQRDLHDGLGPALAAQIFRLGAARQLLELNPKAADNLLGDLEKGLESTMADIRSLVYGLRPLMLDQLGLIGAIKSLINENKNENKSNCHIELELPNQLPHINAATEVAAYRIIQTAVDNVIKHSQATKCKVTVGSGKSLLVKIDDNGIGMTLKTKRGVGLTSIRERAEELGGELSVISLRPSGTSIRVTLPLPQTQETGEKHHD
ncbi:MAG: histidine kinase [Anaerolineae bacterium]